MERRQYLRTVAIAGGTFGIAGCLRMRNAGADGTPTDTPTPKQTPTEGPTEMPAAEPTETPTPELPSNPDQRVAVGDGLNFDPESFEISVGDTVLWEWVGSGHNIKFDDGGVPEGTDWTGTEAARTTTFGEGHVHFHTFETAGTYDYYCVPHRSTGMEASFTVTE
jgi:plastocyanin